MFPKISRVKQEFGEVSAHAEEGSESAALISEAAAAAAAGKPAPSPATVPTASGASASDIDFIPYFQRVSISGDDNTGVSVKKNVIR